MYFTKKFVYLHRERDRSRTGSYLLFIDLVMTSKEIKEKIVPAVEACGCFLVDVTVSADNDVEIEIESKEGTVQMEDCVAIDKAFHRHQFGVNKADIAAKKAEEKAMKARNAAETAEATAAIRKAEAEKAAKEATK